MRKVLYFLRSKAVFRFYLFHARTRFSRKRGGEKRNFRMRRAFLPSVRNLDGKRRRQHVIRRFSPVNEHLWPRGCPAEMNPQFSVTRDTCWTSKLIGDRVARHRVSEIMNEESRQALICSSNGLLYHLYPRWYFYDAAKVHLASPIITKPRLDRIINVASFVRAADFKSHMKKTLRFEIEH